MTTFKIGDKVRTSTHPREAVEGSVPQQPGAKGVVCGIGLDNVNVLRVRHDNNGAEPWYRADDLIAIREVARRAGEKTELERRVTELEAARDRVSLGMERRRLGIEALAGMTLERLVGPLKHRGEEWDPALHAGEETDRVTRLEQQLDFFRDAMASELRDLDQRLAALDPENPREGAPPVAEQQPVVDPPTLARAWVQLSLASRESVQRYLLAEDPRAITECPARIHRCAAESALMTVPGLLADIARCRRNVAGADREIEGLRGRQRELEAERAALTAALADGKDGTLIDLAERRMRELRAHKALHRAVRELRQCGVIFGAESGAVEATDAALQTLAELGVTPGEPYPAKAPEPDDTAPEAAGS